MDELKSQIFNWLTELEEKKAADFFMNCSIDPRFIDLYFSMDGFNETSLFDVTINVPLKIHRKLEQYSEEVSAIESAIKESSQSDGIYVRNIDWRPFVKNSIRANNEKKTEEISKILTHEYVYKQIKLMNDSIESNPHLALGISKELIETCCKHILKEEGVKYEKEWDILKLVKETNKKIDLMPFEVDNKELAVSSIAKVLSGFSNIVQGITELRNSYGTGHGHLPDFKMLDGIYTKLAVSSSSELSVFYLTLMEMKKNKSSC
jgi:hypothetical protein